MIVVTIDGGRVRFYRDGCDITGDMVEAVRWAGDCWRQVHDTFTGRRSYAAPTKPPAPEPPPPKERWVAR